jgi:hypothetical protein
MSPLTHPNSDELAAFATGQVPEQVATEISRHLADCEACRTVIDMVPDDTLLSLLRQQQESAALQADSPSEAPAPTGSSPAAPSAGELPPELAEHSRYHVLELLGTGGMGSVYQAEHRLMERHVALKVINPGLMKKPAAVERFHREVKASQYRHRLRR